MRCGRPEHQLRMQSAGLSQNRTLSQGMPVQEKDQESQSCPDTTPG